MYIGSQHPGNHGCQGLNIAEWNDMSACIPSNYLTSFTHDHVLMNTCFYLITFIVSNTVMFETNLGDISIIFTDQFWLYSILKIYLLYKNKLLTAPTFLHLSSTSSDQRYGNCSRAYPGCWIYEAQIRHFFWKQGLQD
jgi:hypothetical protein